MGVIDGLTALGVIVVFVFIIISQVLKKNPRALDGIKGWIKGTPKQPEELKDKMEQIYPEKRMGL